MNTIAEMTSRVNEILQRFGFQSVLGVTIDTVTGASIHLTNEKEVFALGEFKVEPHGKNSERISVIIDGVKVFALVRKGVYRNESSNS